jgi:hypothetical protein
LKDFLLDENGELVIKNGKIQLVADKELTAQKIRQVLKTHIGEWKYDPEEGIDRYVIFTKKPNYDLVEDTVKSGLLQVDESLRMTSFECTEKENRELFIRFGATDELNEKYDIEL